MSRNRQGNTALILALSLPALLGFVAMAVDWGAVAVARNQVQSAADAAAMAATSSMDDRARAVTLAQTYAANVGINGLPVRVDAADVVFGSWDGTTFTPTDVAPNVVKVTARADLPMTLTRLFGVDSVHIASAAGAGPTVVAKRAPDIVLALDVTGSMDASEIAQERVAAQALLDCVHERSTGESRIGIVLFTGVDTVRAPMLEVGADYTELSSRIAGIRGCGSTGMPACSGTNQAAGIGGALAMLATADTPEGVGQAALVMSDGEPNADAICDASNYTGAGWRPDLQSLCAELGTTTRCTGSGRRRTCTTSQSQPTEATYAAWADDYVDASEAADIDVYTVYYGSETAGISFMEDHVAAGDGFSLVSPTATAMDEAFEDICQAYVGSSAGMVF
jgi:Flp pilus assembly protein TadG